MYPCCHRTLAIMEIVSMAALLGMEIVAAVLIPTAPDAAPGRRSLILSATMLYAISLLLPASLGLLIAHRKKYSLLTALMIAAMLEFVFSACAIVIQFTTMHVRPSIT